jgi:hypothetical protein
MNCPHCGKTIEVQQNRAAASRWLSMTKAERAAEMSRVRKLGVKRRKPAPAPQRDLVYEQEQKDKRFTRFIASDGGVL